MRSFCIKQFQTNFKMSTYQLRIIIIDVCRTVFVQTRNIEYKIINQMFSLNLRLSEQITILEIIRTEIYHNLIK